MLLRIREQVMLWRVYFEMFHGTFLLFHIHIEHLGGARGVMVIVAGYGHGDMSSNPGPDWLHFT